MPFLMSGESRLVRTMSDDKDKKDPPKTDGTGSDPATSGTPTTMGFGELLGHIDSRIESILSKRPGKGDSGTGGGNSGTGTASESDPISVREQLRAELAKLQGEEAAKKKDADRDVTIEELKATVAKLSEAAPAENVSRVTQFMWGKKSKT